jgi:hypothetical protein
MTFDGGSATNFETAYRFLGAERRLIVVCNPVDAVDPGLNDDEGVRGMCLEA